MEIHNSFSRIKGTYFQKSRAVTFPFQGMTIYSTNQHPHYDVDGIIIFLTILIILIIIYFIRRILIKVCLNSKIKSIRQFINEERELQSLTIDNILNPTPSGISTSKAPVPVTSIQIA